MKKNKLLIVIPSFNEELMIKNIISSIPKKIPGISSIKTLVVDDGSKDKTAAIAKRHSDYVVSHLLNQAGK